VISDTDFCQGNVRRFAQAQLETLLRPGVVLGHRHIPVKSVGSYIPGGRYPMFGSAQMSIIPARLRRKSALPLFIWPVKRRRWLTARLTAWTAAGRHGDTPSARGRKKSLSKDVNNAVSE